MSYQVLARKWRPHNFKEVVGQEHVIRALVNALEHNRLHHAYLFTGTRGVGKTTLARILAKALNCAALDAFNPCGQCAVCRAVDEGSFVDLIEVDAASRTKVEDTRELLENVLYAPAQGRYKVYLIDEVHMLSGHSFNALLKTLEEPPPHVKFLLATTDPQKIPVTVLSRCLQLNLKRLSREQIEQQMAFILDQETILFESAALRILARAADGSMRDGLSLLDQAIVYAAGQVTEEQVVSMLGSVSQAPLQTLLKLLAAGDAQGVMERIQALAELSVNFTDLLKALLSMLHRTALIQQVPSMINDDDRSDGIAELAEEITTEDLQLYYQIGLIGQRDLDLAPDLRSGFEMVLLRMLAFRPASNMPTSAAIRHPQQTAPRVSHRQRIEQPVKTAPTTSPAPTVNPLSTTTVATAADQTAIAEPPPKAKTMPSPSESEPFAAAGDTTRWIDIVAATGVQAMTLQLANNCLLKSINDQQCLLQLAPSHETLNTKSAFTNLEQALQAYYGKPIKLIITLEHGNDVTPAVVQERQREERHQAAATTIEQDPTVTALKNVFDATILPGSTEPID